MNIRKSWFQNMKRGRHQWDKGITLVESMVTTMIGALIMGMVMVLYIGANNSMLVGLAMAEVNGNARQAMERIARDLRWSTNIETIRTVGSTAYVTANDELILKVPSIDANDTVIADTYDYIVYALDSTDNARLRRIVDPDAASSRGSSNVIIADNIASFVMSSAGTELEDVGSLSSVSAVEIAITVDKTAATGQTVSETLNSNVELRNN